MITIAKPTTQAARRPQAAKITNPSVTVEPFVEPPPVRSVKLLHR